MENTKFTEMFNAYADEARKILEGAKLTNGATVKEVQSLAEFACSNGSYNLDIMCKLATEKRDITVAFNTYLFGHKDADFEDEQVVNDYQALLDKIAEQYQVYTKEFNEKQDEAYKERIAALEEVKKRKKEARSAEKKQDNLTKQIKKLDSELATAASVADRENFFYALGWIAKHVSDVSAVIPDYCETWFQKNFGNADHTTVAADRTTSGGYKMKYAPSFSISLKGIKDDIPEALVNDVNKNKINNTAFVCCLVLNYGFTFGKQQNIDEIRNTLSPNALITFNEAFNK